MSKIQWNSELSVGVEQIDDQHKELIRIANGLINAISLGRDERILSNVTRKLREYTVFHFASEERLMDEVHYPERGEHANEHARLKKHVKDYQRVIYKNEELTPETVLQFLKEWLLGHILTHDRELARFIHEQKSKSEE